MVSFKVDGREVHLEDVTDQDVSSRKLIGTAEGVDFNHCLYLGMKYGKDFVDRVHAFQKTKSKAQPFAVTFYE